MNIQKSLYARFNKINKNAHKFKLKLQLSAHRFINAIKGNQKPEHIVITGPSLEGSLLISDALKKSIDGNGYYPAETIAALNTINKFKNTYITKSHSDLFDVKDIQEKLSAVRDLKFIIVVADPRDMLTEMHCSIPFQYFQSWDYSFYTEPHPSFTCPGVGKAFEEIDRLKKDGSISFKIVRFEDLLEKPEQIQQELTDFLKTPLGNDWAVEIKAHKGIQKRTDKDEQRISMLLSLFPDIKKRIAEYGYTKLSEEANYNQATNVNFNNGTVVAMHTPDDVYRNEARRMQASMDRLGIKHFIEELPQVEQLAGVENPDDYPQWFLQKLARYYKPTWLVEKRKELRGPILYCDVDAFFHRDPWPYLNLYDGDMAVFSRRNGIVNSATIWMNDTPNALKILKEWARRGEKKRKEVLNSWPDVIPSTSDQPLLRAIVQENYHVSNFFIQRLPQTMLHIFKSKYKTEQNEVFIEQLQASRVAKNKSYDKTKNGKISPRDLRIVELERLL